MRYLSVCSGIEAATVAWHPLGWKAAAYSEIEKFPSEVLAHHYPNTPNVGDMTKFKEWTNVSDVDVLVGGTPCQSFSVAGLRKGLDDPRGNLMLTYLAIAAKYRPKWLVWENVPGVLSSNGGLDFASLLRGMGELGYGFAYRVLDAQYFGVAQRRRRVFVIGYLGNWRPAAAVLFERQSLCGYPAPSRKAREDAARGAGSGAAVSSHWDGDYPHPTLNRASGGVGLSNQEIFSQRGAYLAPQATTHRMGAFGEYSDDGTASTMKARDYKDATDLVAVTFSAQMSVPQTDVGLFQTLQAKNPTAVAYGVGEQPEVGHCLRSGVSKADKHESTTYVAQPVNIYGGNKRADRPEGGFYVRTDEDTSKTLDAATGLNPTCSQGGTAVMQPISIHPHCIGRAPGAGPQGKEYLLDGSAYCMDSRGQPQAVFQPVTYDLFNVTAPVNRQSRTPSDPCHTLARSNAEHAVTVQQSMQVRRLTPVECERLQGFPDDYTDIKPKGKPTPDGLRYKALGNSMAVPVMVWIGKRIQEVEVINAS